MEEPGRKPGLFRLSEWRLDARGSLALVAVVTTTLTGACGGEVGSNDAGDAAADSSAVDADTTVPGDAGAQRDVGALGDVGSSADVGTSSDVGAPEETGLLRVSAEPALAPMPTFGSPVPRPEQISSTFGPRWKTSADRYDFHPGIDYFDAEGTPVAAIGDGVVEAVHPDGSASFPNGGNVLVVRHALPAATMFHGQVVDRFYAVYLHLASFAVADGQRVTRGQVVGAMGRTGDTTFVHLHFETRVQTLCSLQYQVANPMASCAIGFDPHVHPFLFVGGRDDDAITVDEIAPEAGAAWALRYTAGRGDLDLDVIETDLGTLGFGERRGMDATSLARLDDFHYPWLTLVPAPFGSRDEELVMELHFPVRPRFVELRDIHGVGVRVGSP